MSDLFFGIVIGFMGNWLLCAVIVAVWVLADMVMTSRQRRRGSTW